MGSILSCIVDKKFNPIKIPTTKATSNLTLGSPKNILNNISFKRFKTKECAVDVFEEPQLMTSINHNRNFIENQVSATDSKTNSSSNNCLNCNTKKCEKENWVTGKSFIVGLNSTLIYGSIIASQRPTTKLLSSYDILTQLKLSNVSLIINLQREGEHPKCVPYNSSLEQSGFSYFPDDFEMEGIKVEVFGWKNLSNYNFTMPWVVKIIKEILQVENQQKRVLIHCHSGLGRTCTIIACYVIFATKVDYNISSEVNVDKIIEELKELRPGSFRKEEHVKFCHHFNHYISLNLMSFGLKKQPSKTIINTQNIFLVGQESFLYKYVPKILDTILTTMVIIKIRDNIDTLTFISFFNQTEWTEEDEKNLNVTKLFVNNCNFGCLLDAKIYLLKELLIDWFDDCVCQVFSKSKLLEISDVHYKIMKEAPENHLKNPNLVSSEDTNNYKIILEKLRNINLRFYEYETCFCVAFFLSKVVSDKSNVFSFDEYKLYFFLACLILGVKDDSEEDKKYVEKLLIVLKFFSFLIIKDDELLKKHNFSLSNLSVFIENKKQLFKQRKEDKLLNVATSSIFKNDITKESLLDKSLCNTNIKNLRSKSLHRFNLKSSLEIEPNLLNREAQKRDGKEDILILNNNYQNKRRSKIFKTSKVVFDPITFRNSNLRDLPITTKVQEVKRRSVYRKSSGSFKADKKLYSSFINDNLITKSNLTSDCNNSILPDNSLDKLNQVLEQSFLNIKQVFETKQTIVNDKDSFSKTNLNQLFEPKDCGIRLTLKEENPTKLKVGKTIAVKSNDENFKELLNLREKKETPSVARKKSQLVGFAKKTSFVENISPIKSNNLEKKKRMNSIISNYSNKNQNSSNINFLQEFSKSNYLKEHQNFSNISSSQEDMCNPHSDYDKKENTSNNIFNGISFFKSSKESVSEALRRLNTDSNGFNDITDEAKSKIDESTHLPKSVQVKFSIKNDAK